jgi:hypothetical protein
VSLKKLGEDFKNPRIKKKLKQNLSEFSDTGNEVVRGKFIGMCKNDYLIK